MREQEPLIGKYVDMLIDGLKSRCKDGKQNIRDWYNWTTFDIIGDLTYGESFGCLESNENHAWMRIFSDRLAINYFFLNLRSIGLPKLALALTWVMTLRKDLRSFIKGKMALDARIKGEPRPDLMDSLIRKMDEEVYTDPLFPDTISFS